MADNLNLPTVAAAQNQKEVTINAATQQLSGALADYFAVAMGGTNYTLSSTNFEQYMGFSTSGNTAGNTFTVPAVKRALFYVQNGGSASLGVVVGSTTLSVANGTVGFFQTDGTANGLSSVAPVAAGGEADVGFVLSGTPFNAQNINYPLNIAAQLPTSLTGSHFKIGTNPTSTAVFNLFKNGSNIGNLSVATGGAVTVTFASPVSFAIGDTFSVQCPSPQDSTLADVGLNFKFTKL